MRRVGLYGGTFDPIHNGHVETLTSIAEDFRWDEIVLLPAFKQPFKLGQQAVSPFHRFTMAVLATEHDPRFRVSPMELERGATTYTVDTLEELRREQPEASLDWIIGDDNLEQLPQWKSFDRLFELANFVVLRRGREASVPLSMGHRIMPPDDRLQSGALVFAENKRVEVSSTEIRRRAGAGEPIDHLVPPPVARYIARNRLYSSEEKE